MVGSAGRGAQQRLGGGVCLLARRPRRRASRRALPRAPGPPARAARSRCGRASTRLPTWTCASAKAAICGRWVTHSTWWIAASARSRSPSAVGVPAADPGVDLVEDEERRVVGRREHDLERQREAARLAARRDARQRSRRLAGVRGEA